VPLPLSNLVVAALAVGGLATGVGTASAGTTSPSSAQVTAEQVQEQQLRSDIGTLTTTEEHLQASLRNRTATSSGAPPGASSAAQGVDGSPQSGSGSSDLRGTPPTTVTTGNGGKTVSVPSTDGGGSGSTSTGPPTTGPPMTEPPTTEPPTTEPPTTTTTNPPPPPPTTTTNPDSGGDGGGD
jgi:hypothetical protein